MLVEIKRRLEAKDALVLVSRLRKRTTSPLLVAAPFLGPRTREVLAELGASYADSTGNMRVSLLKPFIYLERPGAERNPSPDQRALRSLKGRAAGRVVRALCDYQAPFGLRELARRSRCPVATLYRVVDLLEREALLRRETNGRVISVDRSRTIRRWTQDYSFTNSNRTMTCIDPRGVQTLLKKLTTVSTKYSVTGSLAASQLVKITVPRLASVYVESAQAALDTLDLRPAESGANVILAEPFDPVVFERTWARNGLQYAAATQVAADLLTGPGRSPSEGEAVLAWLAKKGHAREY
jgi:hypothetical protein